MILILTISNISLSKVRVNVDGSVNINFGKRKDSSSSSDRNDSLIIWDDNNSQYSNVGDITDTYYNLKPFILNGKGYAVIRDGQNLYLLQAEFYNSDPNRVKNEQIFKTYIYSSNCLAITGDSSYCLTVTKSGDPALWDRNKGRIKYTGRWVKNQYSNNYYDYYQNSSQSWFEW